MPVGLKSPGPLLSIAGIRLATTHCGIKPGSRKPDLVLIEIAEGATLSAVFTTNKFCAAPVVVAKQHLATHKSQRYLLINSGSANAGTGEQGYVNALACCRAVAACSDLPESSVLPFSTGVIAAQLPVEKILQCIPGLVENLNSDNWLAAAQGIMTTDTLPKAVSEQVRVGDETISITGIAKGSGMIKPDMATMLSFIATDAKIDESVLQDYLAQVIDCSFNAITVDGDTSTNDACVLIASGASQVAVGVNNAPFLKALKTVFQHLAQAIIRDAEGATKFVEIEVRQAASREDAREVGYTIAHSPLVKTALFASDPNWGRILAAIGRAKIDKLDIDSLDLYLGEVCLLRNGLPDSEYREELGQQEMDREHIRIVVNLHQGKYDSTIWTSDLSYDYVKINAEYRS